WIMLEDYFEGAFLESNDIEGFTLRAAWINRMATLDPDDLVNWNEVSSDNDTDGVYGFELEFNQIEDFTLSAVYYRSHGAFSIFGGRLEYHSECSEKAGNDFLVEFYKTRENERFDKGVEQDGYIFHISDTITIDNISVGLGFISADRKSGAGSLLNNPWDPFDEDTHTDLPNAQTYYISTEYSYSDHLTFAALYGISTSDEGDDEEGKFTELNLIMSYTIRENITLETAYVKCDTTDGTREGFDKAWFNLTYGF
ncbi:MAG: Opr family porin, partial [Lentisphaeraceae bacterium]|nr:Opr family porin [Lentisphaeraceae bacterium]